MRSVKEVGNKILKRNIRESLDTLREVLSLIDDDGTTPEYMADNIANDLENVCDDLILMYGIQEIKGKVD